MIFILFKDGKSGMYMRHNIDGACLIGEATVYVIRAGERVYVKPGESVDWVETSQYKN